MHFLWLKISLRIVNDLEKYLILKRIEIFKYLKHVYCWHWERVRLQTVGWDRRWNNDKGVETLLLSDQAQDKAWNDTAPRTEDPWSRSAHPPGSYPGSVGHYWMSVYTSLGTSSAEADCGQCVPFIKHSSVLSMLGAMERWSFSLHIYKYLSFLFKKF